MANFRILVLSSLVALLSITTPLGAARADESENDDISLFIGSMLPNQVDGVSEILPMFGGRYGFGTKIGTFELGGANAHAEGVDYTVVDGSLRGDFDLGDGMHGLIYGGADWTYWRPVTSSDRQSETGFHMGTGATMSVSPNVSLRADFKFMGGPGTSLWLLIGVSFRNTGQ